MLKMWCLIPLVIIVVTSCFLVEETKSAGPTRIYLPAVMYRLPVEIASTRVYAIHGGMLRIIGEVINRSGVTIYSPWVIGEWFDNEGNVIESGVGDIELHAIPPGTTSPFWFEVFDRPEAVRYTFRIGEVPTKPSPYFSPFVSFDVLSSQIRYVPWLEVFGEVTNQTQETLRHPRVLVTFYDAVGDIVEMKTETVANTYTFEPGQTLEYTVKVYDQFSFDHYRIQTQGWLK